MSSNDKKEDKETVFEENVNEDHLDLDDEETYDPYALYKQDEQERFIVPLKHPVKVKAREYTEIHLRAPYGADLRISGNAKNDMDNGLILLERCGEGLTKEAVNKMRATDINACSLVLNFLSKE